MRRLALTFAFCAGCGDFPPMTEARVSSEFDVDTIAAFEAGANELCKVSEGACLPVKVVNRGANVVLLDRLPRDWREGRCASTSAGNATLTQDAWVRVEIAPGCTIQPSTAAHELAHAIGAHGHIDQDGHLMSRSGRPDGCFTARDARFICEARGLSDCSATCSGDPDN